MDLTQLRWLKEAHRLLYDYLHNKDIRDEINGTFYYRHKPLFWYINHLINFSVVLGQGHFYRYYKQELLRDPSYFSRRVVVLFKDTLPNRIYTFFRKCEADVREYQTLVHVVSGRAGATAFYNQQQAAELRRIEQITDPKRQKSAWEEFLEQKLEKTKKTGKTQSEISGEEINKALQQYEQEKDYRGKQVKFVPKQHSPIPTISPEQTVNILKNIQPTTPKTAAEAADYLKAFSGRTAPSQIILPSIVLPVPETISIPTAPVSASPPPPKRPKLGTATKWLIIGIAISISVLLFFNLLETSSLFPPFGTQFGLSSGSSNGGGTTTPPIGTGGGLSYYIPFRDITVQVANPGDAKKQILARWPNAQIQNWDEIIASSIAHTWNPAFVLALWIEESGAQGEPVYDDALGCDPQHPTHDIDISLKCLFNSFKQYDNSRFADFMCKYSESTLSPCIFKTNPNFPPRIKDFYSMLVPGGVTTVIPSGSLISCPLSQDGSGSFNITCGTFKTLNSGGCGHGNPSSYPACMSPPYAICPYSDQLKAAIDVRPQGLNGNNAPVYLPFVRGTSVNWTLASGPITLNGGSWGVKLEYIATTSDGKRIRLDLTHLDPAIDLGANKSGDQIGKTKEGVDADGGHLHTAVSLNGDWLDAISEAHMCTP